MRGLSLALLLTLGLAAPARAALDFDGTNDFTRFGDVLDGTTTGANAVFSITAWIKPDSDAMTNAQIVGKLGDSTCTPASNQRQYLFRLTTSSALQFLWYGALDGTSYRACTGTTSITDTTKWYHVAMTYDGTNGTINDRVLLYVDGVDDACTITLTSGTPSTIPNGTAHLSLGMRVDENGAECAVANMNGQVSDVQFFGRVLTASEISTIASSRLKGMRPTGSAMPVAYWPLDNIKDGLGCLQTEDSFGTNHGGLTNFSAPGGNFSNTNVPGVLPGYSLDFDGTNDYVDLGTNKAIFQNVTAATVTAWVNADVTGTNQRVVTLVSTGTGNQTCRACLLVLTDGTIQCGGRGADADTFQSSTGSAVGTGSWIHYACVFDYDGDTITVYKNGAIDAGPTSVTFTSPTSNTASLQSSFGANIGGASQYFNGKIDDVRFYNAALTGANITSLFNGTDLTTNLADRWTFDTPSGFTQDRAGTNTGTCIGGITTGDVAGRGESYLSYQGWVQ